jgi:outer membrane immunogenic protein
MFRIVTIVVAATAAASFAISASAAEIPNNKITEVSQTFSWSGVYLGADFGGGWSRTNLTNTTSDGAFAWPDLAPGQGIGYDQDGVLGGGYVGMNFQRNNWVYGFELSGSVADIKGGATTVPGAPYSVGDDVFSSKISAVFLATGRIGLAFDRSLLYAKGGYAGASVHSRVSDTVGSQQGAGSDENWRSGFTVGSGWEYALTNNWISGLEYNYVRLWGGSVNLGDATAHYVFNDDSRNLHAFLARISYKFH